MSDRGKECTLYFFNIFLSKLYFSNVTADNNNLRARIYNRGIYLNVSTRIIRFEKSIYYVNNTWSLVHLDNMLP